MHDNHVLLGSGQDSVVDAICVLDLKPLFLTREPLLLYPSNIQHIGVAEHLVERLADGDRDTGLARSGNDVGRHGERRGRDEVEAHGVEAQKGYETVDSAPVLQVTEKSDGAPVDGTQLRANGVNVQESLDKDTSEFTFVKGKTHNVPGWDARQFHHLH